MQPASSSSSSSSHQDAARNGVIISLLDLIPLIFSMLTSDSNVILAEFLKSTVEFVAVTLSWLAIRRLARGGALQYEYGLGKLENLASLAVGLLMVASLGILVYQAVRDLAFPQHISGAGVWVGVGAVSVFGVLNLRVWKKCKLQAQKDNSPLMASQARLFLTRAMSDFFTLAALLLSVALSSFHWAVYIDPVASLFIALAILFTAWGIFSGSLKDLMDRALEEEHQLIILRELARHFNDYSEIREIRSRRAGSRSFIEISLVFDPQWRVEQAQKVATHLIESLQQALPNSVVSIALAPLLPASTGPRTSAT